MKYISGLIRLIIGLACTAFGAFGLTQYYGGDAKDLAKLEKLKAEGQTTWAEIDTMVLEIRIKGSKMYSLPYKFNANGVPAKGTHTFRNYDALDSLTGEVIFLPSDPDISSLHIESELAEARERVRENESSSFGLWLGIGFILFGLFNMYVAYRRFTKKDLHVVSSPPPVPTPSAPYRDSDFV